MSADVAIPNFFYHPRMMGYDFGRSHPLKPERLRRTMALLEAVDPEFSAIDPGLATEADLLRVHSPEYVEFVQGSDTVLDKNAAYEFGLGTQDTPLFPGIWEASLAYTGGSVRAAEAVRDGERLAFGIGGGLHHAQRSFASGFCVFDDPAIACSILRDRFERVAYVDIDLHHGDGVQALFYDDPSVLTFSIHQYSPGFYPGTGHYTETGADLTSINVPLPPQTEGAAWLHGMKEVCAMAFERFEPQAVVLQMGTDPHRLDPLGRLEVLAQHWLGAVEWIRDTNLPIVALGGGGYNITCVPRMWTAAVLTLLDRPLPPFPPQIPAEWGMTGFLDEEAAPQDKGMESVERTVQWWRDRFASGG